MKKIVFIATLLMTLIAQADTLSPAQAPEIIKLCSACHGSQGISPNPAWPHLAGQHQGYLLKQLKDYKTGKTRRDPTMTSIVEKLSDAEMEKLAEFYSNQPLPQGSTPEKYLQRGEKLYRGGDFNQKITACIACHGPKGRGNSEANFPAISGQHALYTRQQLQAFKAHLRHNDMNGIMRDITARMSEEDMQALAWYIQGLY